ncbi:MAG: hypothetical protein AAF620_14230 [Bacteroidota bacterium]
MKKKVPRFEYAIHSIASPETLHELEEMTEAEELEIRREKLRNHMDRLRTLDGKKIF